VRYRVPQELRHDPKAGEPCSRQAGEHFLGDRTRRDLVEQLVIGDQKRGLERAKAVHFELVPDAHGDPAQVELAVAHHPSEALLNARDLFARDTKEQTHLQFTVRQLGNSLCEIAKYRLVRPSLACAVRISKAPNDGRV
jgi:hypothetical protein